MSKKTYVRECDTRPWGNYEVLHHESGFQVKRIEVNPHARFSLQTHAQRDEFWTVVKGEGKATINGKEIKVAPGVRIDISVGAQHRMENIGQTPLVFIEVQIGGYLGEDDIKRLEDDYNRS